MPENDDLPAVVRRAVAAAASTGFGRSCHPAQGRLLRLLAGGVEGGVIGETGTGCGVGLAWLAAGAGPGTTLVSVERDPGRHAAAAEVFDGVPNVTLLLGDWRELAAAAPFDLLALDGGGQGKDTEPPLAPRRWLRPHGTLVMDDFTPMSSWPPVFQGEPDAARLHWLRHPDLLATELRLTPDLATVVARLVVSG
ncbi:class I SAM-dependent methyltransferase [Amycolatopsis sp. OK19-0408]|uniref:Class I SAM-dependent methyltransferase n=1 Tax=Amycolatopsis iheyensis TaxID=2945988 RepID=A0A9X2N3J8_9PSEU|nr:class I SAM-dependent methyltransferase [Amycolatopsis iheyensis]MCR6481289.1 class I SAM-dependent methyltransferase [Amycolatopsis iheyensis]